MAVTSKPTPKGSSTPKHRTRPTRGRYIEVDEGNIRIPTAYINEAKELAEKRSKTNGTDKKVEFNKALAEIINEDWNKLSPAEQALIVSCYGTEDNAKQGLVKGAKINNIKAKAIAGLVAVAATFIIPFISLEGAYMAGNPKVVNAVESLKENNFKIVLNNKQNAGNIVISDRTFSEIKEHKNIAHALYAASAVTQRFAEIAGLPDGNYNIPEIQLTTAAEGGFCEISFKFNKIDDKRTWEGDDTSLSQTQYYTIQSTSLTKDQTNTLFGNIVAILNGGAAPDDVKNFLRNINNRLNNFNIVSNQSKGVTFIDGKEIQYLPDCTPAFNESIIEGIKGEISFADAQNEIFDFLNSDSCKKEGADYTCCQGNIECTLKSLQNFENQKFLGDGVNASSNIESIKKIIDTARNNGIIENGSDLDKLVNSYINSTGIKSSQVLAGILNVYNELGKAEIKITHATAKKVESQEQDTLEYVVEVDIGNTKGIRKFTIDYLKDTFDLKTITELFESKDITPNINENKQERKTIKTKTENISGVKVKTNRSENDLSAAYDNSIDYYEYFNPFSEMDNSKESMDGSEESMDGSEESMVACEDNSVSRLVLQAYHQQQQGSGKKSNLPFTGNKTPSTRQITRYNRNIPHR